MKTKTLVCLAILAAISLFALGWHLGQGSVAQPAGELVNGLIYGNVYSQVLNDSLLVELMDTKRTDEARGLLQLRMDGNILALNNLAETTNSDFPASALKILLMMQFESQSKYGSKTERANKVLARLAKQRSEHPWTNLWKTNATTDPDVAAKLSEILQRASKSQN